MKQVIILPYSQLKKLEGYEALDLKSYNTLKKAIDNILPTAQKQELKCQMAGYGGLDDLTKHEVKNHECRSVACIVGTFPLFMGVKNTDYNAFGEFSYRNFQRRVIPLLDRTSTDVKSMWSYLFDADWNDFQNSFEEGIERMQIVLSGKYNPEWKFTSTNEL